MYKKLHQWMVDLDQKRLDLLSWADVLTLPRDFFQGQDGEDYEFEIGDAWAVDDIVAIEALAYDGQVPWQEESVRKDLIYNSHSLYILAYDITGRAVAFIGAWLVEGQAHITNLCVVEDKQSLGIGTALISLLEEVCQQEKIKLISLEVRLSNRKAQSLYQHLGYRPTFILDAYYHDNQEDAIRMVKAVIEDDTP